MHTDSGHQPSPGDYDFIMNPPQPPKKPILPGKNSSKQTRLFMIFGGLFVLILVMMLLFSLFFSGGSRKDVLIKLANQQAAIVSLSDVGLDKSKSSQTRSFAITAKLSLASARQDLIQLLSKQGVKSGDKRLNDGKDSQTEEKLKAAEQNNQFDTVFNQVIRAKLSEHQKSLQAAHDSATGNEKKTLESQLHQTDLLLSNSTES